MKKTKLVLINLLIVGILIPVLYTLIAIGSFTKSPKVEIQNNVNADAPLLRVAADFDFSPYSFYDENNQVSGLNVELMNEIANRLGMKLEIVFTDWISCKKLLQAKETDLILGLEIFSNLQGVLKTIAVSKDQLLVFGKNAINDISGLKDKKVGLITNSVLEKIYDLNCEYVPYYTNTDVLDAIEHGDIDYGICHGSVAKKILEKTNYKIIPSISLMNSYPAIGVRDDLPELRDKINNILIQLGDEGFFTKLDNKWLIKFTNKVTVQDVLNSDAKLYFIYFILFLFSIFLTVFFLQNDYRKEILMKKSLEYQASLKKQNDMLTSIANVYFTVHAINLVENSVKEIQSSTQARLYVNKTYDAVTQMKSVIQNTVIPEDIEMALTFTDLTTLPQRMENKDSILAEFRGTEIGWFCAQFIVMNRDDSGKLTDVIFTTQSIDEMKKEKEYLLKLSRYDELTRLLNRHAYESKIKELIENDINKVSVVVLDVNSLKATNDKIGHHAGDELIRGAADTIRECFNNIGSCYRVGGDEFLVIIEGDDINLESILENFRTLIDKWKGNLVDKLSLSIGFATFNEIENFTLTKFSELTKLADKRMYEDKALYYNRLGIERRR